MGAAGAHAASDASVTSASGGAPRFRFARAGVPALFVHRSNDPNYHSPLDRAEYVDPAHLAFAGQLTLGVLDALADGR